MVYTKNTLLNLKASSNSKSPELIISRHEWTINNIIQSNTTDNIIVNTNDLKLLPEKNNITLRVQNSEPCNKWSEYMTKIIEVTNMEQTFTVVVDKAKTLTEVTIQMNGTVEVTVKNQIGIPIQNATVKIDTVSAITNELGVATLADISYGTKTGTVTL